MSSQPVLSVNRLRRLLHPSASDAAAPAADPPPRKKQKIEAAVALPQGKKGKGKVVTVATKASGGEKKATTAAPEMEPEAAKKKKRHRRKLSKKRLAPAPSATSADGTKSAKKKPSSALSGGDEQLLASKFRFLNEQLYTLSSSDAFAMFQADPSAFEVYHAGYESQRAKWTEDPLDWVVKQCRLRLPPDGRGVLVDFGCGDARLAGRLADRCRRVHSLDLVALNDRVTACDMARSPLADRCAHAAVFCLSLMNANLPDFLAEASRVLRLRGFLCVVEARSRVERTQRFVNLVERFGFQCCRRREDKYLVYLLFNKSRQRAPGEPLPEIRLKPCLYKKR